MRPPICAVCHTDFRHSSGEGGLVTFTLTEEEKESNKRFDEPGFVGHPEGLEWFCGKHYEQAKALSHLTCSEAIRIIRESEQQ